MIRIKRGDIVHFKIGKTSPLMLGEVQTVGKSIVWMKRIDPKDKTILPAKYATDRRNIYL